VNKGGYTQRNNGLVAPTSAVQPTERALPPSNLSIQAQPGTPRPPSAYSETSTLPYLREDPSPPPPVPSGGRPHSSPFPRFIPPPMPMMLQPLSAPNTPGSMYPPAVDYHSQALAIVGAHPGAARRQEQPAFYPAMMRPQGPIPGRDSMPVEAVMARYGQALPHEPPGSAPIFPRSESAPAPSRRGTGTRRLSRPQHSRRAMSDQQPLQPLPPPPNQHEQSPQSPG
jgi:hypothetical protein